MLRPWLSLFFDDVLSVEVKAGDPIKLYSTDGQAVGYAVDAFSGGTPHGYVVYDFTRNWCVTEFSVAAGARFLPYAVSRQGVLSDETRIVADALSYGAVDSETGEGCDLRSGERLCLHGLSRKWNRENATGERSSDPTSFKQVFTDHATPYKQGYQISSSNALSGYINPTSDEVEFLTHRYACVVSALYTTCSCYVSMGGVSELKDAYYELWDLSNTKVTSTSDGVLYGGTRFSDAGAAVTTFCKNRGRVVTTLHRVWPEWSQFKTSVDSRNGSIFGANLKSNGSGHGMAVVGYFVLVNKNTNQWLETLMVCDGWDVIPRVLPYDTSPYSSYEGVFCAAP